MAGCRNPGTMTATVPDRPATRDLRTNRPGHGDTIPVGQGDAVDGRIADDHRAQERLDAKFRPRRSPGGIAVLVAAGVASVLLPWSVVLAATLPSSYDATHWNLAWVGFDCGIATASGLTAYLLHRKDARAALTAVATGTLLLADAWFDVSTSDPGAGHALSLAEALLLEVPLAICAFVLAGRALRRR